MPGPALGLPHLFRKDAAFLRRHRRALVTIQLGYYTFVGLGMILAVTYPQMSADAWKTTNASLDGYYLGRLVMSAYESKDVFLAAILTFVINVVAGSFLTITLPSVGLPFSGIALTITRATLWGILFPPNGPESTLPHYLTMLVEGQAYIFAALVSWVQGREALLQWRSRHAMTETRISSSKKVRTSYQQTYVLTIRQGLANIFRMYTTITATLLLAAIWEAVEVIYL